MLQIKKTTMKTRKLLFIVFAVAFSFSVLAEEELFGPAKCREEKRDCKEFFEETTGEYGPEERETCRAEKQACKDAQ